MNKLTQLDHGIYLLRVVPRHVRLVFDKLGEANGGVEHHRALRRYHPVPNRVMKVGDLFEGLRLGRKLLGLLSSHMQSSWTAVGHIREHHDS